jgi:hypothetical protein
MVNKLRSLYLCKRYANCVVQHVEKNCHGKVRYVGGWVIAKLIQASRKYINTNISTNMLVRSELHKRFELIKLLERLLVHCSTIHSTSEYSGSLELIEDNAWCT